MIDYIAYFTLIFIVFFLLILYLFVIIYSRMQNDSKYLKRLRTANKWSKDYLNDYLQIVYPKLPNDKSIGVMFDIDDTLVNYYGDPLKDIVEIYKHAKQQGYKIIIITARSSEYKNHTKQELKSLGIDYDFLYMRHPDHNYDTFKEEYKQLIKSKHGIDIVLSLGDQWVDVNGKVSGLGIKLPSIQDENMYIIKRKIEI